LHESWRTDGETRTGKGTNPPQFLTHFLPVTYHHNIHKTYTHTPGSLLHFSCKTLPLLRPVRHGSSHSHRRPQSLDTHSPQPPQTRDLDTISPERETHKHGIISFDHTETPRSLSPFTTTRNTTISSSDSTVTSRSVCPNTHTRQRRRLTTSKSPDASNDL
jgi:hypothetical protein